MPKEMARCSLGSVQLFVRLCSDVLDVRHSQVLHADSDPERWQLLQLHASVIPKYITQHTFGFFSDLFVATLGAPAPK